MRVYMINGEQGIGKTDFAVNLAEYLQKNAKVLLLQGKRSGNSNIEDFFQKDGMITYDIADYLTGLAPLSKVVVNETANLDFIISPLLEEKYDYNGADIIGLLNNVKYDYVVIDNIDKNLLPQKVAVDILSLDNINQPVNADAFFINKVNKDYDVRIDKDLIEGKNGRYLGLVREGEYFTPVIENLMAETAVTIPKLGFFERLRGGFRK